MIILHAISLFVFLIFIGPILKELLHRDVKFNLIGTLIWVTSATILIEMWKMEV